MTVLGSILEFIFGTPHGIAQDIRHGEEEERVAEQEGEAEAADTAKAYAAEEREEQGVKRAEEDEAALETILSKGALKKQDLPPLRAVLNDLRASATEIEESMSSMRQTLADEEHQDKTRMALLRDELRTVLRIRGEAKDVDPRIRDAITAAADKLFAAYQSAISFLLASSKEDKEITTALQYQAQADRQLRSAIEALARYIETGDGAHGREAVEQCKTVTRQIEKAEQFMRQHLRQTLARNDRLERLHGTIRSLWPRLDQAVAETRRAA